MADRNPQRALDIVRRIEMLADFRHHPAIRAAVDAAVPVTMPRDIGALGFDACAAQACPRQWCAVRP